MPRHQRKRSRSWKTERQVSCFCQNAWNAELNKTLIVRLAGIWWGIGSRTEHLRQNMYSLAHVQGLFLALQAFPGCHYDLGLTCHCQTTASMLVLVCQCLWCVSVWTLTGQLWSCQSNIMRRRASPWCPCRRGWHRNTASSWICTVCLAAGCLWGEHRSTLREWEWERVWVGERL